MTTPRNSTAAVAFVMLASHAAFAQAPPAYRADDLGTLGGTYLLAAAMNNNGDIVGSGTVADGTLHAFRWTRAGGLEDLGLFGGIESQASGINDRGDILGFYFDAAFVTHPFILPAGGTMQALDGVFQPSALATNDWFTGMSSNGRAFRAIPGGVVEDISAFISFGSAINASGATAGWSWHADPADEQPTAFRYTDGAGFVDLGTFGGPSSYAYGINAAGTVVGAADTSLGVWHAYRAVPGAALQDLGVLRTGGVSRSVAYAVNDAGDVVGTAEGGGSLTAFRYTDDRGLIDLAPLVPVAARAHGALYSAVAINAQKAIVAIYSDPNGEFRSELLTPRDDVPAPVVSNVSADPRVLMPPNGRMVPVYVTVDVADEYDDSPACTIVSVTDSAGPRFGSNQDVAITGPLSVNLRAKWHEGDDRIYRLNISCVNALGGATAASTVVRVSNR